MRVSRVAMITRLALVLWFLAIVEGGDVTSIITPSLFQEMLKHRNDPICEAKGFYTHNAFITAANYFSEFGTTGDISVRKRELAAFFAQTSHETTGGGPSSPDGPYAWGYCKKNEEHGQEKTYCDPDPEWQCVPGKKYYGRGPMQISRNYNYGPAGKAIHEDLLSHPGLVATDPVISFKTAIWFWMTTQEPKPSCHDVITNRWTPSAADRAAGRAPGFGVITNIINGGAECGKGTSTPEARDRVGFYKRYCEMLGVDPGPNLPCRNQRPFPN